MPDFKNRKRFDGPRRFPARGASFGPREMYDAECASCHRITQVPFRPNGKKPVYCKDCFRPEDGRDTPRRDERPTRSFSDARPAPQQDRRIDDLKRQLDTMQAMLERITTTLEEKNRTESLSKEVRRHIPAAKPAAAPLTKPPKKAPKKAVKKAVKK